MFERIDISTLDATLQKIRAEALEQAAKGNSRLHIDVSFYAPICGTCNKPIPVGEEKDQYGFTQCFKCFKADETFDEEFS